MTDSSEHLARVVNAFQKEGFDLRSLEVGHNTIFDGGFRIDVKVKTELEQAKRIRLSRGLSLNLTTAENLVLMKLDFWDGTSFDGNDAQDLMKILVRQRGAIDMSYIRTEALKRRTYPKLAKIERYLSSTEKARHRAKRGTRPT